MTPNDDRLALRFDLERSSPFFFKCQRCGVCCSNKAINVGPYEIVRLSRNLGITTEEFLGAYLENQSLIVRRRPDGDCIFLAAQGCRVHRDRPLVCRLFPLGLLWDSEGKERLGNMPPHPDCLGYWSDEGTVEAYLETQGVRSYITSENAYSDIIRQIAEKRPGLDLSNHPSSPLFDVDSMVAEYCRKRKIRPPENAAGVIEIHLRALPEWCAG